MLVGRGKGGSHGESGRAWITLADGNSAAVPVMGLSVSVRGRRDQSKCGHPAITGFAMIGALAWSLIIGAHNRQRGYEASSYGPTKYGLLGTLVHAEETWPPPFSSSLPRRRSTYPQTTTVLSIGGSSLPFALHVSVTAPMNSPVC